WYWSHGCPSGDQWPYRDRLTINVVNGDTTANIFAKDRSIVHVLGDLTTTIHVADNSEVVVGGSVMPEASIECEGIVSVFIGGDMFGTLDAPGFVHCWIEGNVYGRVMPGNPSMHLHVGGDFLGSIKTS